MWPKQPKSTVLTLEEEAIIVAFRKHTLLPLDDCLYALQSTITHLTRLACIAVYKDITLANCQMLIKPKKKFKQYPIAY